MGKSENNRKSFLNGPSDNRSLKAAMRHVSEYESFAPSAAERVDEVWGIFGWTKKEVRSYLDGHDPSIKDDAKQAKFKAKVDKFFKENYIAYDKRSHWRGLKDESQKEAFVTWLTKSDNFLSTQYYGWNARLGKYTEDGVYSGDAPGVSKKSKVVEQSKTQNMGKNVKSFSEMNEKESPEGTLAKDKGKVMFTMSKDSGNRKIFVHKNDIGAIFQLCDKKGTPKSQYIVSEKDIDAWTERFEDLGFKRDEAVKKAA